MSIPKYLLREFVKKALEEDIGSGDITTEAIVSDGMYGKAIAMAKEDGIIAGLSIFEEVFHFLDPETVVTLKVSDGQFVKSGDIIAEVYGKVKTILESERVALNFIQRLSGIATYTYNCVKAAEGTKVKIIDTRKTTPLLRVLEKYAVKVGGGENHRFGLYDMVLIKDNHIKAAGGIAEAVKKVKAKVSPYYKIEVEASNLDEVQEALSSKVDVILLDNMGVEKIRRAVDIINGKCMIEISGNISQEDIKLLAPLGIDFISMGKLTHSAKSLDINLKIKEKEII
jgi:nicotinate-nucleotide pyrophosphorylase (carboxylating)